MQNLFDSRIEKLQAQMRKDGLKAYVIPATDPHMSEECTAYFARERFYFCPFKGSDGTLLVTLDGYFIYTDGRFWTEAEGDIKGSSCILMYQGKEGVLSIPQYVKQNNLYPLGLDKKLLSRQELAAYFADDTHEIRQASYRHMVDDLPELPHDKIFKIDDSLLSTTLEERIKNVLEDTKEHNADALILPLLDDIAYVLGYRGNDIPCTPVFYSYLYLTTEGEVTLFIDKERLPLDFPSFIRVLPYEDFYAFLETRKDIKTLIDPFRTNAYIASLLSHPIFAPSPAFEQKSIKGPVEVRNTKEIQAIDGIALLKLQKYLLDTPLEEIDEYKARIFVDRARRENPRCFDLSFETIAALDDNAAMMHYAPSDTNHKTADKNSQLLLVDSGGQYYGGTTDTTRTFLIGKEISEEVKHDYTLTLKSQIALSTTIFEKGCSGHSLDIKAREIMWKEGLDYKCGTGHGVGYMSCVHEGPIGFRFYDRPNRLDNGELKPGHIITVEPGVYKPHKYGIRLENNLLVKEAFTTSDGIFYSFETITYFPYDRRGIDLSLLTDEELQWLNDYHKMTEEILKPLCPRELLPLLEDLCKEIKR